MADLAASDVPRLDHGTFRRLAALIHDLSGITLKEGKETLVWSRLVKRVRALGLKDHGEYLRRLEADPDGEEVVLLLDSIATNVTHFFREGVHFQMVAERFRAAAARGQRRFRYWSAASSSGEEPCSLAMSLIDAGAEPGLDLRILATDLSTRILARARRGEYGEQSLRQLPPGMRRFFERRGELWRVRDEVRALITYNRLNLVRPPFPMQGPFDAVLCRNVMIYFDNDVRRRLLAEILRLLAPGGLLCLGHSESLAGFDLPCRAVGPAAYERPA